MCVCVCVCVCELHCFLQSTVEKKKNLFSRIQEHPSGFTTQHAEGIVSHVEANPTRRADRHARANAELLRGTFQQLNRPRWEVRPHLLAL